MPIQVLENICRYIVDTIILGHKALNIVDKRLRITDRAEHAAFL
jgi:hypothetical protein